MRVIDRYILMSVVRAAGLVALVVCALSVVSSFLGEADNFAAGEYTPLQLLIFVTLKIPEHLHVVMPAVALLGALMGLGGLAAGSELVVLRASGVSVPRLGWSVARAGVVLALVTVVVGELVAPITARISEHGAIVGGAGIQSLQGSLWLREDQRMIRIDQILSEHVIAGVTVYRGTQEEGLRSIVHADAARFENGQWMLHDVSETVFAARGVRVEHRSKMPWRVDLKPTYLRLSVTDPEELSSLGLYRYSNYLRRNGVTAQSYRLAMWRNLTAPFTVLILTILALPFAFGALRGAGAGQRLFVGGIAGLGFFMLNEIAVSSSLVYGAPIWFAATWPTGLLAIGTIYWFRRMR